MGNNNFWEDVGTTFATTMLSGIENTMAAKKKQKRIDTMLSKIDPTGKNRYAKGLSKSGDIEYGFLDPNQQVQRDNLLKLSKNPNYQLQHDPKTGKTYYDTKDNIFSKKKAANLEAATKQVDYNKKIFDLEKAFKEAPDAEQKAKLARILDTAKIEKEKVARQNAIAKEVRDQEDQDMDKEKHLFDIGEDKEKQQKKDAINEYLPTISKAARNMKSPEDFERQMDRDKIPQKYRAAYRKEFMSTRKPFVDSSTADAKVVEAKTKKMTKTEKDNVVAKDSSSLIRRVDSGEDTLDIEDEINARDDIDRATKKELVAVVRDRHKFATKRIQTNKILKKLRTLDGDRAKKKHLKSLRTSKGEQALNDSQIEELIAKSKY